MQQGYALFLRREDPAAESPEATWQQATFPLYHAEGEPAWSAVLPVAPDVSQGGHTLLVGYRRNGESRSVRRSVEVRATRYRTQHLRMARNMAHLYTFPGVQQEDAAVGAAVRARSSSRFWRGDWMLPVRGRLTTPFGVVRYRNGEQVGRHSGVDLAAPTGAAVRAPAAGRVQLTRKFRKYGGTIVLDHGQGVTSMYLHLSRIHVSSGNRVYRGQMIGRVGATGAATGPHLHWSVYAQGTSLNPLFFTRLSENGVQQAQVSRIRRLAMGGRAGRRGSAPALAGHREARRARLARLARVTARRQRVRIAGTRPRVTWASSRSGKPSRSRVRAMVGRAGLRVTDRVRRQRIEQRRRTQQLAQQRRRSQQLAQQRRIERHRRSQQLAQQRRIEQRRRSQQLAQQYRLHVRRLARAAAKRLYAQRLAGRVSRPSKQWRGAQQAPRLARAELRRRRNLRQRERRVVAAGKQHENRKAIRSARAFTPRRNRL